MKKTSISIILSLFRMVLIIPFAIMVTRISVGGIVMACGVFLTTFVIAIVEHFVGWTDKEETLSFTVNELWMSAAFACLSTIWAANYLFTVVIICTGCLTIWAKMHLSSCDMKESTSTTCLKLLKIVLQTITLFVLLADTAIDYRTVFGSSLAESFVSISGTILMIVTGVIAVLSCLAYVKDRFADE